MGRCAACRARHLAGEPGAVHQQLFDGDRPEARIDRLAEARERSRQHGAERSGERQPSGINQVSDADGGNGLRQTRDRRRRGGVHAAEAECRYQLAVAHHGDAGSGDLILRHPLPERSVQGRRRRVWANTRLGRDAQQACPATTRRPGGRPAGRGGGKARGRSCATFQRPPVCRIGGRRGSLDPGRRANTAGASKSREPSGELFLCHRPDERHLL